MEKKIAEARNTLIRWGQEANAGTTTLPITMYYIRNSDATITFLNKFTNTYTIPPGYTGTVTGIGWLSSLYSSTNNGPADYILRQWRGYKDNTGVAPVRYILPVHSAVVTSSRNAVYNTGLYGY